MPRTGRVQERGGPSGQHPEQIPQGQLPEPGSQSLTGTSEHTGPRCWLDGCHLLDKDAPADMTGTFSAPLDPELMLFRAHGTRAGLTLTGGLPLASTSTRLVE